MVNTEKKRKYRVFSTSSIFDSSLNESISKQDQAMPVTMKNKQTSDLDFKSQNVTFGVAAITPTFNTR